MKGLLLSRAEWRFAGLSFLVKITLFWLAELVVCALDQDRMIGQFIARGFWPCVFSFALMNGLVISQLRHWLQR